MVSPIFLQFLQEEQREVSLIQMMRPWRCVLIGALKTPDASDNIGLCHDCGTLFLYQTDF